MNAKVSEVLRRICVEKKKGVLVGEAKERKRAVFFNAGAIVGAQSSLKQDRLGALLVRHGRITKEHLEEASRSIKSGRKLGAILADMGAIDSKEIDGFVKLQVTDIACSLLIEPPRRLAFTALREVEDVVSQPLVVAELIMEAARRTPYISTLREELLQDERPLALSSRPLTRAEELSLALEEKMLVSRIDGKRPLSALVPLSPLPEESTLRFLLGLLHAGIVVTDEEPAVSETESSDAASGHPKANEPDDPNADTKLRAAIEQAFQLAQSRDHWAVLGVARGASGEALKHAFHEVVRRYHPDRLGHVRDEDLQNKASSIVQRAGEAFRALSTGGADSGDTSQVGEPTAHHGGPAKTTGASVQTSREAKEFFIRAKRAYEDENYWDAIQLCREAVERCGDQAEYYHLLGLALSQNRKWQKEAEQNLQIAAKLEPWKVKYLAALGELYLKAGLRTRARTVFDQAKTVDPDFIPPDMK